MFKPGDEVIIIDRKGDPIEVRYRMEIEKAYILKESRNIIKGQNWWIVEYLSAGTWHVRDIAEKCLIHFCWQYEFKEGAIYKAITQYSQPNICKVNIERIIPSIYPGKKLLICNHYNKNEKCLQEYMVTEEQMISDIERAKKVKAGK